MNSVGGVIPKKGAEINFFRILFQERGKKEGAAY